MAENQDRENRERSKYDTMTTEELSELLRLDSEAPDGQSLDTESLLYIMEVLAERNRGNCGKTAQEAWVSFQQNYLPNVQTVETPKDSPKRGKLWLRRAVAVAAVVAVLVCIPLASFAGGWKDVWNATAKWTKDTFYFERTRETEATKPSVVVGDYESLQQAFAETGRECNFLPTWIPDRFELDEIIVDESPVHNAYVGVYCCGEKYIQIGAIYHMGTGSGIGEKSEGAVEIYETADNRYYIYNNLDRLCAAWVYDNYECHITGDLSVEEMKMMIDSIGKG